LSRFRLGSQDLIQLLIADAPLPGARELQPQAPPRASVEKF
jgi:hypothetical protein